MFEEMFVICYKLIQKYTSKATFSVAETSNETPSELKNFLAASYTFELQDYCYRLFLKNIFFFFVVSLPLFFFGIKYFENFDFFLLAALTFFVSLISTFLYTLAIIKLYRKQFIFYTEAINRFYKHPKLYDSRNLLLASFFSSLDELSFFFNKLYLFDLIVYLKTKKFMITAYPQHKVSINFEIFKQLFLGIFFGFFYIIILTTVFELFTFFNYSFIQKLIFIKILSILIFCSFKIFQFFVLFFFC